MPDFTLEVAPSNPFVLDLAEHDIDLELIAAQGTSTYGRQFLNRANQAEALAHLGLTAKPPFIQSAKPNQHADGSPLQEFDRWFSTLDRLWFFWSGSYWLTEELYRNNNGSATAALIPADSNGLDYWIESFELAAVTGVTNNASNYCQYDLQYRTNTTDVVLSTITTAQIAPQTRFYLRNSVNLHIDSSAVNITSFRYIQYFIGSPNAPTFTSSCIVYRFAKP